MNRVMSDFCRQVVEVARRHRRFNPEAYLFVFQALKYAQEEMGLGGPVRTARPRATTGASAAAESPQAEAAPATEGVTAEAPIENHITGQQLCEAIRQLALREFGFMAKAVFRAWGLTRSGDFGDMVYHLIEVELMRKNDRDRREDFDDVFDFEAGLSQCFRIEVPDDDE